MEHSTPQINSFRYFRWRTSRKGPEKVYQYRSRIESRDRTKPCKPRLEYVNELFAVKSTATLQTVQEKPLPHAFSTSRITPGKLAKPAPRRHSTATRNVELTVDARAVPVTKRPVERPRSAPLLLPTTSRYKKSVVEKPFPYPNPRSVVGMQPAFKRRLAELAHLEQQTIMAEEARKRTLSPTASSSSRAPVARTTSVTSLSKGMKKMSVEAKPAQSRKQYSIKEDTESRDVVKPVSSCIEINSGAQSELAAKMSNLPGHSMDQSYVNSGTTLSKSCIVLEKYLNETLEENSSDSDSSTSSNQETTDTDSFSDISCSVININSSSSGEVVKEKNTLSPELTEENDSGVQADLYTSESTNALEDTTHHDDNVNRNLADGHHELPTISSTVSLPASATNSRLDGKKTTHTKTRTRRSKRRPSTSTRQEKISTQTSFHSVDKIVCAKHSRKSAKSKS